VVTALSRVCTALNEAGVRYAVVGGYAVALHGAVRGTLDIDIAIDWSRTALAATERALASLGLVSRLPVSADDVFLSRDDYVSNRNLIAWNFYNPEDVSEQVDIIIAYDLTDKRTMPVRLSECIVPVLSIADLIEMKRRSGRPQDREDAAALEKLR
jgi:hypothetical protein